MLKRSSIYKGCKKGRPWGAALSLSRRLLLRLTAFPAGFSCASSDLAAFLGGEGFGPRATALKPSASAKGHGGGVLTAFAGRTNGLAHNTGGKLVGVQLLTT